MPGIDLLDQSLISKNLFLRLNADGKHFQRFQCERGFYYVDVATSTIVLPPSTTKAYLGFASFNTLLEAVQKDLYERRAFLNAHRLALETELTADDFSLNRFHLVGSLYGTGSTELHITTVHRAPGDEPYETPGLTTVFDSKLSDPAVYLSSCKKPSFFARIKNSFFGLFRSLLNWGVFSDSHLSSRIEASDTEVALADVQYESLGTQSFLDGVTCGYHTIGTQQLLIKMIRNGKPITRENLLAAIDEENPVRYSAQFLDSDKEESRVSFMPFVRATWNDTFTSSHGKSGVNYIFDIPKKVTWRYFASCKFLWFPLKTIIFKTPELVLSAVINTLDYLRNALYQMTPTSRLGKFFRSSALLVVQLIFNPLNIFRKLWHFATSPESTVNQQEKEDELYYQPDLSGNEDGHFDEVVNDSDRQHSHARMRTRGLTATTRVDTGIDGDGDGHVVSLSAARQVSHQAEHVAHVSEGEETEYRFR